jgi:ABC-type uncharacterized transport system permease subunit
MANVSEPLGPALIGADRIPGDLSVRIRRGAEYVAIPMFALAVSSVLFSIFLVALGKSPIPGSWNQGLSSGQGLMAVALVIFARWKPLQCVVAALLFGAAGAIGPALQSVGITQGYYFFNAAPYILTLLIMIASAGSKQAMRDVPGELSITK